MQAGLYNYDGDAIELDAPDALQGSGILQQRRPKAAISPALQEEGARRGSLLRGLGLILGHGLTLSMVGLLGGLIVALAVTRLMANLLYGISATDPITFTLIGLLLIGVTLLACYIPARRATRVDPMIALRNE